MKDTYEKHQALSHYDEYIMQDIALEELQRILKLERNKKSILKEKVSHLEIEGIKSDVLFAIEKGLQDNFKQILISAISFQKKEMKTTLLICEQEVNYTLKLIKKAKKEK